MSPMPLKENASSSLFSDFVFFFESSDLSDFLAQPHPMRAIEPIPARTALLLTLTLPMRYHPSIYFMSQPVERISPAVSRLLSAGAGLLQAFPMGVHHDRPCPTILP